MEKIVLAEPEVKTYDAAELQETLSQAQRITVTVD